MSYVGTLSYTFYLSCCSCVFCCCTQELVWTNLIGHAMTSTSLKSNVVWGPSYGDTVVTITTRSRDSTIPSPHLHRDSASMGVLQTPLYGCVYLYVFICINILILSDALMHLCIDVLYAFTCMHLRTCDLMRVCTYIFIRICMCLRNYILLLGLSSVSPYLHIPIGIGESSSLSK